MLEMFRPRSLAELDDLVFEEAVSALSVADSVADSVEDSADFVVDFSVESVEALSDELSEELSVVASSVLAAPLPKEEPVMLFSRLWNFSCAASASFFLLAQ